MGVAAYGAASVKAVPDLVRVRFKVIRLEKTPAESFAWASGKDPPGGASGAYQPTI